MQSTPKQELVGLLQLAQRERQREESKRNRRLVESKTDHLERRVEQRALSWRQRRNIGQGEPRTVFVRRDRRSLWNDTHVRNRQIGLGWVASSITERANLLEPCRLDPSGVSRDPTRGVDHRLIRLGLVVRHPPALTRSCFVRTNE